MDIATDQRAQDYSASVRLELRTHAKVYELSQVGDGTIVLRRPEIVPAGPAQIVVAIDGSVKIHDVVIYPHAPDDDDDEVFFW